MKLKININDIWITKYGAIVLITQIKPYILANMEWVYIDHEQKISYEGELFLSMRYEDNGELWGMPNSNLYKKIGIL